MKLRQHLGSLLFLAALGASVTLAAVDRGAAPAARAGADVPVLAAFDAGEVTGIQIVRSDAPAPLVLQRRSGGEPFVLESPHAGRVDGAAVRDLLASLTAARAVRVVPDFAPSGAPLLTLTLSFSKGAPRTLRLGPLAPTPQGAAYALVEGRPPVVVPAAFVADLSRPFDVYRERALVPFGAADLAAVSFGAPRKTATREGAGAFLLDGQRVARAVGDGWLRGVAELRATRLLRSGKAGSAPTFELISRSGVRASFVVGRDCDDAPGELTITLSTATELIAACVPAAAVAPFVVSDEAAVRDRSIFATRLDELSEITVDPAPGATTITSLSLARVGGTFRQRRPSADGAGRELDGAEADVATDWLAGLLAARGELVGPPPGAPPPLMRVTLHKSAAEPPERVALVEVPAGGALVHREADGAWLAAPPELRGALDVPAEGIVAPYFASVVGGATLAGGFDAGRVTRLAIECGTSSEIVARKPEGFAFEKPASLPVDAGRVVTLLERLGRGRGRGVAVPAGAARVCGLELALDGDARPVWLELLESAGTSFVSARVRSGVSRGAAVVAHGLLELVREPLVARDALATVATRVELLAPVAVAPDSAPDRAALATDLVALLPELRALRVESLGAPPAAAGFSAPLLAFRAYAEGAAPATYRFVRAGSDFLVRRSDLDVTFRVGAGAVPGPLRALPRAKP